MNFKPEHECPTPPPTHPSLCLLIHRPFQSFSWTHIYVFLLPCFFSPSHSTPSPTPRLQIETSFAGVDIGLQAGLHFVANDWTKLGHDFGATMYDLLNEGGMVYSQAHAAVTHMLPPKIEESAYSSSPSTTTSSSSSDRKLKTSGGKRLKKKKKKSTGRAKTAEAGMRRKR